MAPKRKAQTAAAASEGVTEPATAKSKGNPSPATVAAAASVSEGSASTTAAAGGAGAASSGCLIVRAVTASQLATSPAIILPRRADTGLGKPDDDDSDEDDDGEGEGEDGDSDGDGADESGDEKQSAKSKPRGKSKNSAAATATTTPASGIAAGSDILDAFVWPLSKAEFMREVWRQKAYAVVPASTGTANNTPSAGTSAAAAKKRKNIPSASASLADRFRSVCSRLHELDLTEMLQSTPSEKIHVWMKPAASAGAAATTRLDSFAVEAEAAFGCHAAGGSLYFRANESASSVLVSSFAKAIGYHAAAYYPNGDARAEVETFVSRAGHVTDWHFDYMDNYTFQLSGRKRWTFRRGPIEAPLRGYTPHYKTTANREEQFKVHRFVDPTFSTKSVPASIPRVGETDSKTGKSAAAAAAAETYEVILEPGSILYHPPGIWHRVECVDGGASGGGDVSISINVSFMPQTYAELFCDALKQQLLSHAAWRAPVLTTVGGSIDDAMARVNALLQFGGDLRPFALPNQLNARDLLLQANVLPRKRVITVLDSAPKPPPVTPSAKYQINPIAVLMKMSDCYTDAERASSAAAAAASAAASTDGDDADEKHETRHNYSLHSNFANENVESGVHVTIQTDDAHAAVLDALIAAASGGNAFLRDAVTGQLPAKADLVRVNRILHAACDVGYIRVVAL